MTTKEMFEQQILSYSLTIVSLIISLTSIGYVFSDLLYNNNNFIILIFGYCYSVLSFFGIKQYGKTIHILP